MRAVHHEVARRRTGGGVDRDHRLGERGAVGQNAVGLDRERDHDRRVARLGGADDTDRLGRVRQGERGDEVGAGVGERLDLRTVIGLGGVGIHGSEIGVRVTARADAPADDDGRAGLPFPEPEEEVDGPAIHVAQPGRVEAESLAPVGAGAPRQGFEHEAAVVGLAETQVAAEVLAHHQFGVAVVVQDETGEVGQVDPTVEDEVGLDPAVGEEDLARRLGQHEETLTAGRGTRRAR